MHKFCRCSAGFAAQCLRPEGASLSSTRTTFTAIATVPGRSEKEVSGFPLFDYRNGRLYGESVQLDRIAREFGTPCYVYSRAALVAAYREFDTAFSGRDHLVCYAVKATPSGHSQLFARLGALRYCFRGELQRVLKQVAIRKK